MFEKLKAMFAPAPAVPAAVQAALPPLRDGNGRRIYHEYFIAEAPDTDGNWQWHARVYSSIAPKEGRGAQPNAAAAHEAALAWCNSTKLNLAR